MNKTADENEEVKNRAATAAITSMIGLSCANIHLFANAGEMIWRTPWKSSMARTWMEGRLKWLWRKTDPNLVPDRDHEAGHEADLHPNLGLDPVHVNPTSLPAQTRAKMPTNLSMEKERIQYNCQSLIVFPLPFIRPIIYFSPFLLILPLFSRLPVLLSFLLSCFISIGGLHVCGSLDRYIFRHNLFFLFSFSYFFPNLSWHSITISLCR